MPDTIILAFESRSTKQKRRPNNSLKLTRQPKETSAQLKQLNGRREFLNIMILNRDAAALTVVQLVRPKSGNQLSTGTGCFVVTGNRGFIVTAHHVAREMDAQSYVIVSDTDSKPNRLKWSELITINGSKPNWKVHTVADIAIIELSPTQVVVDRYLKGRFLDLKMFESEITAPSRDLILTSVGFPLGLGAIQYFSPLTFESKASSGLLTLDRADTRTPSNFFVLQNPSIGGYSGCPVFDLSIVTIGAMTTTGSGTKCYGIMHGTVSDVTGGKLALVTPSHYLFDLIT